MADLSGAQGTPPTGPNSFNFMQFLGNFGKIVCWRPLLGEILDPPLLWTHFVAKQDRRLLSTARCEYIKEVIAQFSAAASCFCDTS